MIRQEKQRGEDILWFIWKNKHSPVFGKERMATFERYFIDATETHEEPKNATTVSLRRKRL